MIKQRSAGFIIFYQELGTIKFLVLQYTYANQHWDFPRGGVEVGESDLDAGYREIEEETGLQGLKHIEGFSATTSWNYKWEGQLVFKEVIYFIAESLTKEVKLSKEHKSFKWLDAKQVTDQLTFDNPKNIFKKAVVFLTQKGILD